MAKEQQSQIALLNLEQTLLELKASFAKISSKNPDTLRVPKLHMVNEDEFLDKNLDIKVAVANSKVARYAKKLTATKYLPTVSVGARYTKILPVARGARDKFTNYSLRVTMPLSVNFANDLEKAKLDALIATIKAKNAKHSAKVDYNLVKKKLAIINRQIALSNKEASIYKKLMISTKRLYKAGQKSKNDVKLLRNSYKIKKLDAKIYAINKDIELLKLYAKMR
jgi:outer membrane protein TolC